MEVYNWEGFIDFADWLEMERAAVESAGRVSGDTISRVVLSRAYYGVFNILRKAAIRKGLLMPRGEPNIHSRVTEDVALSMGLKESRRILKSLKNLRVWADYGFEDEYSSESSRPPVKLTSKDVRDNLTLARVALLEIIRLTSPQ